jgi:Zn-dependent protease
MDPTVQRLVAAAIIILVSFPVHEFAHAWVAYRLGDSTARYLGRLTLNPIVHFDPTGGFLLLVSSYAGAPIGWAKPTPVNFANLRNGRLGEAMVTAAGPISNLLLAAAGGIVFRVLRGVATSPGQVDALNVVGIFVEINVILFIFNLIPVPPLDGTRVLLAALPPRTAFQFTPILYQYGQYVLLALIFIPLLTGVEGPLQFVFDHVGFPITQFLTGT